MSTDEALRIDVVDRTSAGELLTLRRAAFVTEAQRFDDPHLPALTQTLRELEEDLERTDVVTLGAWQGHRLIGSLRVELAGDRATLGRLAVVPDLQGRGVGTQILLAVLQYLPEETQEVWLYTGNGHATNLADAAWGGEIDARTGDLTYSYLRRILGDTELAAAAMRAREAEHADDGEGPAPENPAAPADGRG